MHHPLCFWVLVFLTLCRRCCIVLHKTTRTALKLNLARQIYTKLWETGTTWINRSTVSAESIEEFKDLLSTPDQNETKVWTDCVGVFWPFLRMWQKWSCRWQCQLTYPVKIKIKEVCLITWKMCRKFPLNPKYFSFFFVCVSVSVCVCVCVRACVRACVRVCVRACVCVGGCFESELLRAQLCWFAPYPWGAEKKPDLWRNRYYCHIRWPCSWRHWYRLLGTKWQHSRSCFCGFETFIFNKPDEK